MIHANPTTIEAVSPLHAATRRYRSATERLTVRVTVCAGTGCVANGSLDVYEKLREEVAAQGLDVFVRLRYEEDDSDNRRSSQGAVRLTQSGCQGFCQKGPLVAIDGVTADTILYTTVRAGDVAEIVETTLRQGLLVERLLYVDQHRQTTCRGPAEIPFYKAQQRMVLGACGKIDPEDLHEYIALGGYEAARRAWCEWTPEAVCEEVKASGLRGRGGGGFPTGTKWAFTLEAEDTTKYVICNADEGDPGAFMDRSIMEGNPHAVIEGMIIAAHAVGAIVGYFYVRLEYPLAVARIRKAVHDAEQMGLIGADVFGTGRALRLHVMEGAGAFVCGEETALIASIEGKRGMPRPKPPFPAQRGLWDHPTVINNVETLATVPLIIRDGVEAYRSRGTENSPGTKTFALTGHVANTGLIEVPFGATLREIIYDIGGGVIDDDGNPAPDGFKAVQIGGPSGGCLTADHLDLSLDFDSLRSIGAMVGSGGLVVMNRGTCIVQMARFFMQFTQNESCGKCLLCREGTKQMLAMLDQIIAGEGSAATLELLAQLADTVAKGSLCGLGKTAPSPVLSALRHFEEEVHAHVFDKRCPAGQCKALAEPEILADRCKGCTACVRKCPVSAITGQRKQAHVIDPSACIKCGACAAVCRFDAIIGV